MNETSKMLAIREARGDFEIYLQGQGIDVGCGLDPLRIGQGDVLEWDQSQGDASYLVGVPDSSMDFVYSSHCLEHLHDPETALWHWARVLKPGGHLYLVVPDYLHYEKCRWPSIFNADHRQSFSLAITRSDVRRTDHWHIDSDLRPLLERIGLDLTRTELELFGYDWNNGHLDQTLGQAVTQICIVASKH